MRILILSDDFPPQSFGGAGFSTFYLSGALQKSGHEVFVITSCQKKSEEGELDYQGLKIFRIYANYHERWRAYLSLYNPQTVNKVRKLIKEINPDVVHAHNIHYYLSYYCLKLAKNARKAVFLTARDAMAVSYGKLATKQYQEQLDPRLSWLDNLKEAGKRYNPLRNLIIRKYLGCIDQVFSVSQSLKEALVKNGIKNVTVSHNGIDISDWQVSEAEISDFKKKYNLLNKKIVFFGGRISDLKGINQIRQAMDIIRKEIPETVLLIAGKEGIGWLTGQELKAAYWASDIVVVPSIYLDPFPRSNLEAMACKRPVIGTKFGGTSEVVQDGATGFIVNPFDIELMAERIKDLLNNQEKARQFGEAGFQRIKEKFTLDSQVKQTIEWYKKYAK